MVGTINKVILIGNMGKDPEIRYTQDGGKVASFSLATSDSWKDKATGERKENIQWHRVAVFNDALADIIEKYSKKGQKVYVEGSLQNRKYTGNDGVERNITEVVINKFKGDFQILDSKNTSHDQHDSGFENSHKPKDEPRKEQSNKEFLVDELDDDIPF